MKAWYSKHYKTLQSFTVLCFTLFLSIAITTFFHSCANIVPPGGGPRDTTAPRLLHINPPNLSKNLYPKKLTLQFDEYIELKEINKNIIITPALKRNPEIDFKLRTVYLNFRDSLEKNTTYSIQFGKAIVDINEGNIFKNYVYTFSTGSHIDSGQIKGRVRLAETGLIDSNAYVVLHKNLSDTAILKLDPKYYTAVRGDGYFEFNYLPVDSFNVFVLPATYIKKYMDSTGIFAFLNAPILAKPQADSIVLYAFREKEKTKEKEKKAVAAKEKNASSNKKQKEEKKILSYTSSLDKGKQDLLKPTLILSFNVPIEIKDSASLRFFDSTNQTIPVHKTFVKDKNQLYLQPSFWLPENKYQLILPKQAIADSLGITLAKQDTLNFYTHASSFYGNLQMKINPKDTGKNLILQIVKSNGDILEAIPLTTLLISRPLFYAGEYSLRILYDTNGNGKWDRGNYAKKLQPEIVKDLNQTLSVKSNWETEVELKIE